MWKSSSAALSTPRTADARPFTMVMSSGPDRMSFALRVMRSKRSSRKTLNWDREAMDMEPRMVTTCSFRARAFSASRLIMARISDIITEQTKRLRIISTTVKTRSAARARSR